MSSSLFQNIAENSEDAMQAYINSDKYRELHDEVFSRIDEFRDKLSCTEQMQYDQLIDEIIAFYAAYSDQAYVTGVVNGIALKQSIMTP